MVSRAWVRPLAFIDKVPIYDPADLPSLPAPQKIVVGHTCIAIDDSVFIMQPFSRAALTWFGDNIVRWVDEDPSEENREQMMGMLQSCEKQMGEYAELVREATRKDWINQIAVPYLDSMMEGGGSVVEVEIDTDRKDIRIFVCGTGRRTAKDRATVHIPRFKLEPSTAESEKVLAGLKTADWRWPTGDDSCRLSCEWWLSSPKGRIGVRLRALLPAHLEIPVPMELKSATYIFS